MDGEGMQLTTKYTGMDTEFELEWQKNKDKELTRLFWNKFNVSVHGFFFTDLSRAYYNMVRVIEGKFT